MSYRVDSEDRTFEHWRGEVSERLRATDDRLERIEAKLDALGNAKAKLYGGAAVIVAILGVLQWQLN